ncbi:MAG: nucleotidyltransferase domain-containing protein [Alphaproteobacteria bacterium]|nr:nucleotidyltransferase domain-containing protein [Alphaproteobacteria bacterium]
MALPVQSVRAAPEHRDILSAVADLLRHDKADHLRQLLSRMEDVPVGPFRSEADALAFLRDRLVATLAPEAIWLFGSRARREAGPQSDFDLLVVLPDGRDEGAYSPATVSAPLIACGLAFDVVPARSSDFLKDRNDPGSLVGQAVREGRQIFAKKQRRE